MYDSLIPAALRRIELNTKLLTDVQGAVAAAAPQPDPFALARVRRDRKGALDRYVMDRDAGALAATMTQLDEAEAAAHGPVADAPDSAEVLVYLRNLPELFAAAEPRPSDRSPEPFSSGSRFWG